MTRRIIIAIVVNVWLVLIAAGCSTYFITRSILVADLDETIIARVMSLPGVARSSSISLSTPDELDRYVIRGADGRVMNPLVAPPPNAGRAMPPPVVEARSFSQLANGSWLRTLQIKTFAQEVDPGDPPRMMTVIYSASADHIASLLSNLLYSLSFFAILAAAVTAFAAHSVAKAALKPLRATSDVIGAIDERSLDRRIDVEKLPSELAPVGQRLNDMLGRLETAFASRRQFLADASHELRTPVAVLVTTLEVALRRPREADDYIKALDRCLADAKLLHQLVVALIEQARVEQFSRRSELGPLAVSAVLRDCVRLVEPLAQERALVLSCDVPTDTVALVDEQMLRSCVGNLLSNAIEYTPQGRQGKDGRITLRAEIIPTAPDTPLPTILRDAIPEGVDATACRLKIYVKDNGPGIPPEHIDRVFDAFYRADATRTVSHNHLGLGLALVRSHMRALGGECGVTCPPPGEATGCVFVLDLPTVRMAPDALHTISKPMPAKRLQTATRQT